MKERCAVRAAWACAVRAGSGGDVSAAEVALVEVVVLVVVEEVEGAGGPVLEDRVEDVGGWLELAVVVGEEAEAMTLSRIGKKGEG